MAASYQLFFLITVVALDIPFLIASSFRSKLPIKSSYTLRAILLLQLICVVLQYTSYLLTASRKSATLLYATVFAFFYAYAIRSYLFYLYARYVGGATSTPEGKLGKLAKVPLYCFLILITSSLFSNILFKYDPIEGYVLGPLYFFVYLIPFIYVVLTYVFIWKYRQKINRLTKKAIIVANLIIVAGIFVHMILYEDCAIALIAMIAIVVMYLYSSNPYFYTIPDMNVFGRSAFAAVARENGSVLGKNDAILMHIDNYRTMRYIYDGESLNDMKIAIANFLKSCHLKRIYYLDNGIFLMICRKDTTPSEIATLKGRFEVPWDFSAGSHSISASFVSIPKQCDYINYPKIDKYAEFIFGDMHYASVGIDIEFTEELAKKAEYDKRVEEALKHAVEHNEIEVYFQPIIDANSGKVVSLEALARLHDEELGSISPDYFINTAEKMGLIDELDEQVIRKTCHYLSEYKLYELGIERVEVNLSPIQCMRKNFAEQMQTLCNSCNHTPVKINFEITESHSLSAKKLRSDMGRLSLGGHRFLLDDYGTGYSNFINIKTLPFAVIKIDKSLIWNHFEDGGKSTTLQGLVNLIKDMNVEVLAEGVETKEMAEALIDMGFDYLQGFYYAKPMPITDLLSYLKRYR